MKLIKKLLILSTTICLFSCASNDVENSENKKTISPAVSTNKTEQIVKEPEKIKEEEPVSSSKNVNYTLDIKTKLNETTTGTAFKTPFSVIAKDSSNNPVSNVSVRFEYPVNKKNGTVNYATTDVITNDSGIASFTPSDVSFSVADSISAYPTPSNNREKTVKAAKEKAVKCDFKIKSGFYKKHICLYTYEYDERNKPKNNFYNIIGEVRNLGGTNIGNGPFNDAKLINESPEKLLDYLRGLGYFPIDKYEYLIVGTVKFVEPTKKVETGYSCKMVADIYAYDIKTGEIVYKTVTEATGSGKNWGQDQNDCKTQIGKKIVNDLLYTLK